MDGTDLASVVSTKQLYKWDKGPIAIGEAVELAQPKHKVVAYDYGIKHNILRMLVGEGCDVTVVPARRARKMCWR